MPCGSRSRRNRRNRHQQQHKRVQRPTGSPQGNASTSNGNSEVINDEEPPSPPQSSFIPKSHDEDHSDDDDAIIENNSEAKTEKEEEEEEEETKIDGATLTITTERLCPDELPNIQNMSTARSRLMRRNNRCKIEKKTLNTDMQICEITTIRNAVPMEARIDHIPGVGIVESVKERSPTENPSSTVTISEPEEPVEPLPEELATKVDSIPGIKTCMALAIPIKRFDFLEIHEVTDSEAELDSNAQKPSQQAIVIEAESDVERESSMDEKKKESSEDEWDESMPWEMEKQLRNFIEGLKLPSSPTERSEAAAAAFSKLPESDATHCAGRDTPRGTNKSTRKRAALAGALGSYQSQMSQEPNRCLGIIQEESESKSRDDIDQQAEEARVVDDKQHIRDFINEEIGKFQRERRDLKSVLKPGRNSMDMEDEEEQSVDSVREKDEKDKSVDADSRLIEDKNAVSKLGKSKKKVKRVAFKDTDDICDISLEDSYSNIYTVNINAKIGEPESGTSQRKTVQSTEAECKKIENIKNLVRDLKENVISKPDDVKETISAKENIAGSASASSQGIENTVVQDDINNADENKRTDATKTVPSLDKSETTERTIQVDDIIDLTSEKRDFEKLRENTAENKLETNLDSHNFSSKHVDDEIKNSHTAGEEEEIEEIRRASESDLKDEDIILMDEAAPGDENSYDHITEDEIPIKKHPYNNDSDISDSESVDPRVIYFLNSMFGVSTRPDEDERINIINLNNDGEFVDSEDTEYIKMRITELDDFSDEEADIKESNQNKKDSLDDQNIKDNDKSSNEKRKQNQETDAEESYNSEEYDNSEESEGYVPLKITEILDENSTKNIEVDKSKEDKNKNYDRIGERVFFPNIFATMRNPYHGYRFHERPNLYRSRPGVNKKVKIKDFNNSDASYDDSEDSDACMPLTITEIDNADTSDTEFDNIKTVKSSNFPENYITEEHSNSKKEASENEKISDTEVSETIENNKPLDEGKVDKTELLPENNENKIIDTTAVQADESKSIENNTSPKLKHAIKTQVSQSEVEKNAVTEIEVSSVSNEKPPSEIDIEKQLIKTDDEKSTHAECINLESETKLKSQTAKENLIKENISNIVPEVLKESETELLKEIHIISTELEKNSENITSKIIENDTIPEPPLRSTSFKQRNTLHNTTSEKIINSQNSPPAPPVRRKKLVHDIDTRYPPDCPPCTQQSPKFAIFHQRALNAFNINDKIEVVDFVRALLNILSNEESSREDVQNLIRQYDLEKLPANIRSIVDDLMAPTPRNSISAANDGYAELCNYLNEVDKKVGTGEPANVKIDANHVTVNHSETPLNEKFSNFTHAFLPARVPQEEKNETSSFVEIRESSRCETFTESVCKKSVITSESKTCSISSAKKIGQNNKTTVVPSELSTNAVSPTEFQGHQDSSSSTASFNTAKYNPLLSPVADITSVSEKQQHKDSRNAKPGSKPNHIVGSSHKLLNGDEEKERHKNILEAESPPPIPCAPLDDYLYYVPLDQANQNGEDVGECNSTDDLPKPLKDLCLTKILSMPCGEELMHEITETKYNIFKSLNTLNESLKGAEIDKQTSDHKMSKTINKSTEAKEGESYEEICDRKLEALASNTLNAEIKEMKRRKTSNWTGVPTKENPKVLVCFSPAQQETPIKTSADNLLDLHTKYMNRRGYHHHHSKSKSPPKYFVDVTPLNNNQTDAQQQTESSNRLLNILKQNPVPPKPSSNGYVSHPAYNENAKSPSHQDESERLRASRLQDWLNFSHRPLESDNNVAVAAAAATVQSASGNVLIESREHEWHDKTYSSSSRHVNSALIDTTKPDSPQTIRNAMTTPTPVYRRSPISFNSAIIDKSPTASSTPEFNKRQQPTATSVIGRVGIDPWYVNPALIIEDKPEVPPRVKKVVTVDRDCIDTRSIFDPTPQVRSTTPSSNRVRNDEEPELKQVSTQEIMDNLKQLQAGMKDHMDKRKRYSLPQEYFEKQLKYIEKLENQLNNVIVAEDEEKRAAQELQRQINKNKHRSRPVSVCESSFLDRPSKRITFDPMNFMKSKDDNCITDKNVWKEMSKTEEGDNSEYKNKEGSHEKRKEVKNENGILSQMTSEKMEQREEHTITMNNLVNKDSTTGSKLKDFLRDLNDPNLDRLYSLSKPSENHEKAKDHEPKPIIKTTDRPVSIAAIPTTGEVFRQQMYNEYVHKVLEREERKQHHVIKISSHSDLPEAKKPRKRSEDYSSLNKIEREFMEKAKNRLHKYNIKLDESETEGASSGNELVTKEQQQHHHQQHYVETKFLLDGREVKDARGLPKHLREFIELADAKAERTDEIDDATGEEKLQGGIWSPSGDSSKQQQQQQQQQRQTSPERGKDRRDEAIQPVWQPSSAGPSPTPERKEFRPVTFESPVLSRKKIEPQQPAKPTPSSSAASPGVAPIPPWKESSQKRETLVQNSCSSSRIVNSYSAPSQGLNTLANAPRLPRAQNPTITLLQKAREGQLPKGAAYLDETDHIAPSRTDDKPLLSPGEVTYKLKKGYESEPETYARPKKMADVVGPRKCEGIGPTTRTGIPIVLRSEVKDANQAKWYKQMYDSLHRIPKKDDYVTIRYKPHRGTRTGYSGTSSGYLSEPEPRSYTERSATLDSRRLRQRNKENDFATSTLPRPAGRLDGHYSPDTYHMQPGRIEDYVPGNCSIQEKETKEPPTTDLTWEKRKWWDEVMDIFDGWLDENGRLQNPRGPIPQNNGTDGLNGAATAPTLPHLLQRSASSRSSGIASAYANRLSHSVSNRQAAAAAPPTSNNQMSLHEISALTRHYSTSGSVSSLMSMSRPKRLPDLKGSLLKDLELNVDPQQRLRELRLLESLLELANNEAASGLGHNGRGLRARSGSMGDSERRIIRPLGDDDDDDDDIEWGFLGPVELQTRLALNMPFRNLPPHQQQQLHHHQAQQQLNLRHQTIMANAQQQKQQQHHHQQQQQQQQTTTNLSSSASSSSSVTNSSSNGTTSNTSTNNHAAPFEQSSTHSPKSYMTHALKESGYESDSTLVFRRREDASPLSPIEQRIAYKTVQKGGDVPLHGLRKPAPERPKDDTEIEYFPISPTLTRIRVHRKSSCSSATTASPASSTSSMNVSRIPVMSMAANRRSQQSPTTKSPHHPPLLRRTVTTTTTSVVSSCTLDGKVPSPPKRKSSRNNRTLKLYSSSVKSPDDSALNHVARHEQCFIEEQLSNIRLLKEKLNANLEKYTRDREESPKQKIVVRTLSASPVALLRQPVSNTSLDVKKRKSEPCLTRNPCDSGESTVGRIKSRISVSTSPVARSPKVPLLRKTTEIKSTIARAASKGSLAGSSKDLRTAERTCQHVSRARTTNSSIKKDTKIRKGKKEQEEACKRAGRSPAVDLTSPVEVRRVLQKQKDKDRVPRSVSTKILPSGTFVKSSTAPLVSSIGTSRLKLDNKSLKVTVAMSPKGRDMFKKSPESSKASMTLKQRKSKDKSSTSPKSESKQSLSDSKLKTRKDMKTGTSSPVKSRSKESSKNSSKSNSLERAKSSERMSKSEITTPVLTIDILRQHHEATMSDSFFQHLFLRDILLTSSQTNPLRKSSVLDRVRLFQEIGYSDSYKSEPSLKSLSTYLAHKRPVSNSRFKNWERESLSSRSSSPYGIRSSSSKFNKYDSYLRVDEFGSSSSLRGRSPDLTRECPKERSLSEPPLKTLRESPDSRSPQRSPSPSPVRSPAIRKIQSLRQDTDNLSKKSRARSASEMDDINKFKQTFGSNTSLTRSTNSLMNFPAGHEDYQQYILEKLHSRQKSKRYKDLYDFYTSLERMGKLEKTTSSGDLRPRLRNEEIIDYERWKQVRAKEKAEQELINLYKKLKLVQKEKDFLFSTRDVEQYKWRGDCSLRCKERSVENIKEQFRKLENQESDLEATRQREIAAKKDTYKPLWRGSSVVNVATTMTRKAAEKSDFDRSSIQASLQKSLGGSNKFWSSLSIEQVTALKNQLNDIYGNDPVQPKKIIKTKCSSPATDISTSSFIQGTSEIHKEHLDDGIAYAKHTKINSLISDSDQSSMSVSDYEIVVPKKKRDVSPDDGLGLHVRCHSMIATDRSRRSDESDAMKRSGSISRVSSLERSQSDRVPGSVPMTEVEKKRLSLSLGQEMLEKVSQRLKSSMIKPRETHGALAATLAKSTSSVSPRTCSSMDAPTSDDTSKSKERNDFVLVLTSKEDGPEQKERVERVMKEWSKKSPTVTVTHTEGIDQVDSATESSDTSVRTVVRLSSECDDLTKKVEFYEKIKERTDKTPRSSSKTPSKLSSSQSFADLKELFGESTSAKYRALPRMRSRSASPASKAERAAVDCNSRGGRSSSVSPDVVASTRHQQQQQQRTCSQRDERPRSVSPYRVASPTDYYDSSGSLESLWQRSGSPDPEKYWRTYLKLVRDGTVRRLRAKFESLEELHSSRRRLALVPKRFQSDPELARNLLKKVTDTTKNYIKPHEIPDVAWLRRKYEPPRGRRRRGGVSPIPRIPWKLDNLIMPHINVISKTAELKESVARKPVGSISHKEETKELEARRAVNRVREMFERSTSPDSKTSILGEMFTSAPNVHELRDIAPYLAGRWVAHQYPSRYDNSRSLSSPPDLSRDSETSSQPSKGSMTPPTRKKRLASSRASSASPVRPRTPVSILKPTHSNTDVFANQPFDPSKHRPRFRYQPPPPPLPVLPSPKLKYRSRPWCPTIPSYNARPTVVTFEGPRAMILTRYRV